jgi:hypothetical protein
MVYAGDMPSYSIIFLQSFIKTGTGDQAILRFGLRN